MMKTYTKKLNFLLDQIKDKVELENILRDIEVLCCRIESQEYKNTDFLGRQQFDTPRRTYEFVNYFIGYYEQSLAWVSILKKIPLNEIKIIFDFCAGRAPKVQWALKQLDYRDKLFIFDKDKTACQQLSLFLSILQVNYQYLFIDQDIYQLHSEQADLITANHVLDDLVLDDYCKIKKIPLATVYNSEEIFRIMIQDIPKNLDVEKFCARVFQAIHLKLKNQGYVIMNHYLSVTEKALNLREWSAWILVLLTQLCTIFIKNGYAQRQPLAESNSGSTFLILQKSKEGYVI